MVSENSITIIIPALNEEKRLEATVSTVVRSLKKHFDAFEVIIFNDGSKDRTGEIADSLAKRFDYVKAVHHKAPVCVGGIYKEGIRLSTMSYIMRINGKNDLTEENFDKIFKMREKAEIVIPYTTNINERSMFRKSVSRTFTGLLNLIFGLKLRYYNHFVLYKKKLPASVAIRTDSYAFQAEILIKLIKAGFSYVEVPVEDTYEPGIPTKAFYFANIRMVAVFIFALIYDIYFLKNPLAQ